MNKVLAPFRKELDQDTSVCIRKATVATSELLVQIANDSSLGLFRVQEHIHKKAPQLIDDRQALLDLRAALDIAARDTAEIQLLLRGMDRIDSFAKCIEYLNSIQQQQQQ